MHHNHVIFILSSKTLMTRPSTDEIFLTNDVTIEHDAIEIDAFSRNISHEILVQKDNELTLNKRLVCFISYLL